MNWKLSPAGVVLQWVALICNLLVVLVKFATWDFNWLLPFNVLFVLWFCYALTKHREAVMAESVES